MRPEIGIGVSLFAEQRKYLESRSTDDLVKLVEETKKQFPIRRGAKLLVASLATGGQFYIADYFDVSKEYGNVLLVGYAVGMLYIAYQAMRGTLELVISTDCKDILQQRRENNQIKEG